MASLEQKQEYYEYGGVYTFKQPPRLDPVVVEALNRRGGFDAQGRPLWRFVWGGTVVVKDSPDAKGGLVLGDIEGVTYKRGVLTPRYLDQKVKTFVAHCFRNRKGKGKVVRVRDSRRVPAGVMHWDEWEYSHFGKLRWYLERRCTAEQLIASAVYAADDPELPREGDYIHKLTVESDDGLYQEPDVAWVEVVCKHLHEEESASLTDLLARYREAREERYAREEREEEEAGMVELEDRYSQAMREPVNPVYSIPERV